VKRYLARSALRQAIVYLVLAALALVALGPIWAVFVDSTRSVEEINAGPSLLPSTHFLENFSFVVLARFGFRNSFQRAVLNSIFLAIATTCLTGYFSALTAYGLHAYRFKGRTFLLSFILFVIAVPTTLFTLGVYKVTLRFNLADSYLPFMIISVAVPGTVFFIKQYMEEVVQQDLIDAARIDGAREISIFHRIIIPVIVPSLAVMSVFAFASSWSGYLLPYVLLNKVELQTLPMIMLFLRDTAGISDMAILISAAPVIALFLFVSKYVISGLTLGALKE
jgi:multiple sugar transport system permease protein